MLSVGFVLFRLVDDNETGKADARLASRQRCRSTSRRELRRAGGPRRGPSSAATKLVATRPAHATTPAALRRRLAAIARHHGATRIDGHARRRRSSRTPATPSRAVPLRPPARRLAAAPTRAARRSPSPTRPPFAARVAALTGLDAVVTVDGRTVGVDAAPALDGARCPPAAERSGPRARGYRGASFDSAGLRRPERRA